MSRALSRTGFYLMAFLSLGTALYSFRFIAVPFDLWPGIDAGIRGVVERVPLQALTHMIVAPIALFTGPFQFVPGLRAARPALHRWTGRLYIAACMIAGIAGLATAPYASGGPVAGLGFGTLAVLWIVTNFRAWRAAVGRDIVGHRRLMLYSFAMTFGAATLRLQIPIGLIFLGFHSYSAMSVWLAYTAWLPNVILVWLYLTLFERRSLWATAA